MSFSHNGIRDNLTNLAAPPYFYENLKRELAVRERSGTPLFLIRFLLFDSESGLAIREELKSDVAILNFAEHLNSSLRREDLCARLGVAEFIAIFNGGRDQAEGLSERILVQWSYPHMHAEFSILEAHKGESALESLARLDGEELRRVTSKSTS
jgi:GGDEF domain-containing protein